MPYSRQAARFDNAPVKTRRRTSVHISIAAYTPRASLSVGGNRGSAAILLTDTAAQLCAAFFDRPGYPAARCTFRPAFTLVFGSAVHAAIEDFYRAHLAGEARPDVDRLLFTYRSAWLTSDLDQVTFGSSESRESLDRLAEKMLRAFLASDLARETPRVLAVEEQLQGQIIPGVPDVLARLDLVTEDDDSLVITDFKTSRGKWSPEQAEESAGQLLLYSELAKEYAPGKKVALAFTVLTKTASPTIERHSVDVTPGKLARTKKMFERVWAAMQSGVYYPAPSVMNCSGCGYKTACRAWAG